MYSLRARELHLVCALLGAALLCGCASDGASKEDRLATLDALVWRVESTPPRAWIRDRSTLLGRAQDSGRYAAAGTATAVSKDGYFLTAAHCVEKGPPHLLDKSFVVPKLARDMIPTRVVWADRDLDVAVIHAETVPRKAFELANQPAVGVGVCSGGYVDGELSVSIAAGEVTELMPKSRFEFARRFEHTCPPRKGESGGPTLDADGRLVGINLGGRYSYSWFGLSGEWTSRASWIDPQWLNALLEEDRSQRGGAGGDQADEEE